MKIKRIFKYVLIILIVFIFFFNYDINLANASEINNETLNKETIQKDTFTIMKYDSRTNTTTEIVLDNNLLNKRKEKINNNYIILNPKKEEDILNNRKLLESDDPTQNKVNDTSFHPNKAICQITYNGGSGTGTLIGKKTLLTCAHCVFDNNNQKFVNWVAHAGKIGSSEYGQTGWSVVYYSKTWSETHDKEYDWAVCVLNDSLGANINDYVEAVYYTEYNDLKDIPIMNYGYPSSHGGIYPYNSFGNISEVHDRYFRNTAYVEKGYSGGPVLNSDNRVIGVIHGQFQYFEQNACGVRINETLAETIMQAFEEFE